MVVVDASVAVTACLSEAGWVPLAGMDLVAPRLLWSESASVLHELRWRGQITSSLAAVALTRLTDAPVAVRQPKNLLSAAWRIADDLGLAKTYDAEYIALASLLRCPLVTTDAKLRLTASRSISVVGPTEL